MKILNFNVGIIANYENPIFLREDHETNESHKFQFENFKIVGNLIIPCENHDNHKNQIILWDNQENHENPRIPLDKNENQ